MGQRVMFATMKVKPGMRDDLIAEFAPMFDQVETEPGTRSYVLVAADDDADTLWFWEHYDDQAAMDSHMGSEALAAMHTALGEYLVDGSAITGTVARSKS